MRISEFEKEQGMEKGSVKKILEQNGIEVTSTSRTITEQEIDIVKKAGGKAEAPKAAPKEDKPKAAPKAEAPKAEAPKAEAPKAEAPKAAPQQGKPAQGGQPQKSRIVMAFNPQNSRMGGGQQRPAQGGQRPNGGQNGYGQRPANGGQGGQRPAQGTQGGHNNQRPAASPARTPIRPLTPPSPTPTVQMVPEKVPAKKPQAAPEVKENAVPVAEIASAPAVETKAPAESKPAESRPAENRTPENRPQGQTGSYDRQNRGQGDRNQYQNRGNGDRNQYQNRGQGDRNQYQGRPNNGGNGYQGQGQNRGGAGYGKTGERTQQSQGGYGQRPYRQGGENGQGGTRGGYNNAGPGRGYNSGARDSRPNAGQGAQYGNRRDAGAGKGFAAAAPIKDGGEKNRENRRKGNNERDKRKEIAFEDEEAKARPGRFIKPEKKKEEVVEEVIKVITLPDTISIKELAEKMKQRPADLIKKLFLAGKMVTLNDEVTYEDAENIAMEYEILCEHEVKVDVIEELLKEEEEDEATLVERPPVVCVMGHVDHGKTSLLDAIRNTRVTDREAGGITQAIGAYTVEAQGRKITFLDTPGHEAFTAMRMRGANSTDIAILVVAADDGVMPQTVEAINHAKAAGVEVIVAVNKIDKPSANIERVKQELSEYELIPEDWGGSTVFAPVSAKTGEGIENLLDMILLTADVLELKANPDRKARGLVIEAELDKGRGPVATVLVQKGTLHVGDFISAGAAYGKVRAMIDDKGRRVKEATPSMPVEILGLSDVPEAGEVFLAHENDKTAKNYAETYKAENKEKKLEEIKGRMSLEDLFSKIKEGNLKELNLIVKADVQGSVEAVKQSLTKLSNEEVVVKCIHGGVGAINESDVSLASASDAIIIGFNVRPDATAKESAERENVDLRLYSVIYQAIEDIELAMKGLLDPVYEEKIIGHAEVRQIFKASAIGNIAGSYVMDGEIRRGCKVRVTREGELIWEGPLASLKRFKDDVKEVKTGFECGLVFDGFDKMQELDMVEAYIMVEVPR